MKSVFILLFVVSVFTAGAQQISEKLDKAYQRFESDSQLRAAISSLYVINAKTGEVVFDKNSRIGMATASTLKVITAATAYQILGQQFRYKTEFGYLGRIENGSLNGSFYAIGSGDPTFGSWRYASTKPETYIDSLFASFKRNKLQSVRGKSSVLLLDISRYSKQIFSDYWIWQDLANYYGVGSTSFNWRENQFDVVVKPGKKEGDPIESMVHKPLYARKTIGVVNGGLLTGKPGSGDQSIFYPLLETGGNVHYTFTGTVPAGVDSFIVSASHPLPDQYFWTNLMEYTFEKKQSQGLNSFINGINYFTGTYLSDSTNTPNYKKANRTPLYIHNSPYLDSIIYFFLKKSINLYGEALVKTIAYEKNGFGETEKGIDILRTFWKSKGIDPLELKMVDGSGLSPLNRVTTHAQVQVLQYAKSQSWFKGYYDAFPEYNGMKMKSGTINGVKGFCGYQKAADGNEYIFSFLVNNYNGSASSLVNKMYKVLDELKR